MVPETLVGIIAFVASAGPGYLYVQAAELYGPRRDRSTLEEAAELLVVGSIATGAAFLLALAVVRVDADAAANDPGRYALANPLCVLAVLGVTILVSYGGVWLVVTQILYRGKAREIQPGGTMWYAAFRSFVPKDHGTLVTVERTDGSAFSGLLASATADDAGSREVLLIAPENRPLYARSKPGVEPVACSDTFVVIRAEDIALISGSYLPVTATAK